MEISLSLKNRFLDPALAILGAFLRGEGGHDWSGQDETTRCRRKLLPERLYPGTGNRGKTI